ncbi:MAG TPA: peptidylprolyl isomerase [Acidimicrobiales bacterium]|nr:peptidylprolyl isomerase [Acidimicrobiales bacterium]
MPSSKRERQRAQRQAKVAHVERRRRTRQRARRVVITLIVAGAIVGVIILVSGGSSPKKAARSTTTTTSSTTSTTTSTTSPVSHTAIAPTCPPATALGAAKRVIAFTKQPPICIRRGVHYEATVVTDVGRFVIDLLPNAQLRAVNNFVFLARYHFFDGIIFHRVIPGFVVQGGDPTGTGSGGPGYEWTGNTPPATCAAKADCYAAFDVAYANSGSSTKTNGSQFFIILPGGQTKLSPSYTLFGRVVSGISVIERIGRDGSTSGTPVHIHHMISVTITQSPA